MLQHLQCYVKEFPTLYWLLHKTIHYTVTSMYKQSLQRITLPANVLRELWDLPNNDIKKENNLALLKILSGLRDLLRVFLGK